MRMLWIVAMCLGIASFSLRGDENDAPVKGDHEVRSGGGDGAALEGAGGTKPAASKPEGVPISSLPQLCQPTQGPSIK